MTYCCCTPQIHCRYCQKAGKPFRDVQSFFNLNDKPTERQQEQTAEDLENALYKADYWKRMHDGVRAELIRVLNERPLIQPKYWVSLSDEDKIDCANYDYRDQCVDATERKLRELNEVQQRKPMPLKEVERVLYVNTKLNPNLRDDRELISYIINAVRAIEAAHGIYAPTELKE